MHTFPDLLTHVHRWCCTDEALPPSHAWFAANGLDPPGTLAAALPPQPAERREASQDARAIVGILEDWSLEAMITCVAQDVARIRGSSAFPRPVL
jgi:hypothetical protein